MKSCKKIGLIGGAGKYLDDLIEQCVIYKNHEYSEQLSKTKTIEGLYSQYKGKNMAL